MKNLVDNNTLAPIDGKTTIGEHSSAFDVLLIIRYVFLF
jgi:hypothetical protein